MTTLQVEIQKPAAASLTITGTRMDRLSITSKGLGMPGLIPRTSYAEDSPHVDGRLPIQSVWENTNIAIPLRIRETTPALLQAAIDEVADYISQFSYTTVITKNGITSTWRCHRGSMVLANGALTPEDLNLLVEFYTVTIPCQPVGA